MFFMVVSQTEGVIWRDAWISLDMEPELLRRVLPAIVPRCAEDEDEDDMIPPIFQQPDPKIECFLGIELLRMSSWYSIPMY